VTPSQTLEALKKPFVRGSSVGGGLGLAIVDSVMKQLGGSLTLISPVMGRVSGFEARLQFHCALDDRPAKVERVSIEISKAKTKKDARLELEMTRPVTAAASTSLRSFRTYLLVVPAQRAQLRTRRGRRRRVWASNHRL
jgi:hypothetical protein